MNELHEKNDAFIFSIINNLKLIEDPHSYGNKILKGYKVFESYQELERQELTKSQDIDYVVSELQHFSK